MKNLNLIKWLWDDSHEKQKPQRFARYAAMLIMLLTLGVGQMWAWGTISLNGNFTGNNWGQATYNINYSLGDGGAHTFLPIYTTSGDKYWRLYHSGDGGTYTLSPASDNYVIGYGTRYQVKGNGDKNFKTTVNAGVVAVHSDQNGDSDVSGSYTEPCVWIERPTIYIWHNWGGNTSNWGNNGGSGQKAMTDKNNGTYTYDGVYSASGTNVGIEGTAAIKKYFADNASTKVGSPASGDKCRFTWNANGYVGYDSETSNRGTLTITKLWKITYDGNGNGGGSAPDDEYVMHNTATATYTNTGSMTKTNMAFIGWNERADGTGTHYDAGANITLTADKTLYAEWVPCWVLRGGNSGSSDGSDAMGDWTPQEMTIIGTNAFMIELTLAANTTYYFKIADRHNGKKADYSTYTHYGCNGTMTTTTLDWAFYTSHGNCQLTTGASGGGTWRFAWNASSKYLCVYAPADAPKSSFAQGKYIYFDARANSTWKTSEFKAKFWFKNLASGADDGDISCLHTAALDDWVYYALVPANKTWGSVQMNSLNASTDEFNYDANTIYARGRSNANQNCMVVPSSGGSGVTLSWGTYCPPMSSATLSDNSTTRIVWQADGNDGSTSGKAIWVSTSNTIEVSGAATKALNDDNMTINYDFKVDGSSAQAGTGNTYSKGSLSNGTTYTITMDAYNTYNGATGTKLTASQTLYYKAYNTYSVTNNLTNISSSGRSGDNAVAHGVGYETTLSVGTGYNLPTSVTVKCGESTLDGSGTNYNYNSSTGVLNINDASVTGNITIIASGDAKTYTDDDNLNKNTGDSHGQYTATYDATTISIKPAPTKENYHVEGYYLESGCTNKIADAEGNLVSGVTVDAVQYTDGDGKWKKDGNVTLYTKWEENSFTVTVNAGTYGKVGDNQSSISVTGHPITASDNFTVTANDGYAFSHWTFSVASVAETNFVSRGGTNNATQTYNITATAAVTITANYVVRYGLYGSLDNMDSGNEYGMPGWGVSADFTYSEGSYTITRTLTRPNANYKFRVLDRRNNFSYGCSENYTYAKNDEKLTLSSGDYNAFIGTAGKGSYQLTVTEVSSGAYPAVQITSHPESYVVHFGKKAFTPDGDELGDLDATITVTDDADNTYADGTYIASGETVEIEASEVEGYTFVGWFADDSYSYEFGDKENPHSWTVSEAVNAYAKYEEDANIFEGDVEGYETEWSQGDNWSKERVPKITDVVYINKPVIVNTSAKAKRVIISNNGDTKTGKLTINAGKKLIVAQTIRKYDGSSLVATTENDLVINSDGTLGVGALVWGEANHSPGAATVNFYSISGGAKDDKASVNQFIGTPFTSETSSWLYNYYNSWVLGVNYSGSTPAFYPLSNETMDPFKGYCIIYNGSTGHTYNMSGTLVTNADHTCSSLSYKSGDASNMANENLLANPWLAPIKIAQMETTDFTNAPATIYIFNSTSEETNGSKTVTAGNYASYPIKSAGDNVIPAMQSFSVFTTAASGSVALDYSKIVYDPAGETNPVANKAPKRVAEEEANKVRVYVSAESGYGDMVYMWERSDFNEGFENGWDGHKIAGDKEAPQFYAVTPDGNMAVNCVPNYEGTILGFKAGTEDSTYTFSFEYNNEDDALYLYDIDENKYTRVLEGNTYTFSTTDKTEHNRFILTRNMPQNPTGIENKYQDGVKAVKFLEDGKLFILRSGKLYDATGALVK